MTAPKTLSDAERRNLLNDLCSLKSDDDDAVSQDAKWFLPLDAHTRALRHETLVVRGGRGAGKSALFHFLGHMQAEPNLASVLGAVSLGNTRWQEGFSSAAEHPSLAVVGDFAAKADDDERRFFWYGWLCRCLALAADSRLPAGQLADAVKANTGPAAIALATRAQLDALNGWMDGIERNRNNAVVITYDALDRIGSTLAVRQQMTASLLAMWLSLADRYRRIRPKVFVREDLFQGSLAAFADASKLDARSVSLDWHVEDLYRVLIKHMANTSEGLKTWIEGSTKGIPLSLNGALGWMPPTALSEKGKQSQKWFVDHLAGEQMGGAVKKGFTYRWIPNRLQDAHSRIVPRSILNLIRNAAAFATEGTPGAKRLRLLTPSELQGALNQTSKRRVNELKEEFPVVDRLETLRGKTVMLDRKEALKALSSATSTQDHLGNDGEEVLRILIELGVMSERPDRRIDVPDIYRYGFGILRKGGVKRPM
jgi:hypothetical protein